MNTPDEILVSTTSSIEGFPVRQYLKPVTAHLVAGTNLFSDIGASLTDIFGGRSSTYQNQIIQLYHGAVEEIKLAARELGANCILGLKIDMDEISGGGKSMFMLTVIGTAVIIDKKETVDMPGHSTTASVPLERLKILEKRKECLEQIAEGSFALNKDSWRFVIDNQIEEAFPFILQKLHECVKIFGLDSKELKDYQKLIISFLGRMPVSKTTGLLYSRLTAEKEELIKKQLMGIISEMNLFDFDAIHKMLSSQEFNIRKMGVSLSITNKKAYINKDLDDLMKIRSAIEAGFPERGKRIMKKSLLSSKEKEMWVCECGETNDLKTTCGKCNKDIYGFKSNETGPEDAMEEIDNKIELIRKVLA